MHRRGSKGYAINTMYFFQITDNIAQSYDDLWHMNIHCIHNGGLLLELSWPRPNVTTTPGDHMVYLLYQSHDAQDADISFRDTYGTYLEVKALPDTQYTFTVGIITNCLSLAIKQTRIRAQQ